MGAWVNGFLGKWNMRHLAVFHVLVATLLLVSSVSCGRATRTVIKTVIVVANRTGTIAGALSYPAVEKPPERVAAFRVDRGQRPITVLVPEYTPTYTLTHVPAGKYKVYAYPEGRGEGYWTPEDVGAYTRTVQCGLAAECTDHRLITVRVQAGEKIVGVNPTDWSPNWSGAGPGAYPADPGAAKLIPIATQSPVLARIMSQDVTLIKAKGYDPDIEQFASTPDGAGGALYAWVSSNNRNRGGNGVFLNVFFFDGTRFLGTGTLGDGNIVRVSAAGSGAINVTYDTYRPNDPLCCPSGIPATITYAWDGVRLTRSGTLPTFR